MTSSMYLIVQIKWSRGSTQNGEHVIDQTTRKKEARGLLRHHFLSTLNVIQKHFMYDIHDFDLDEENYSITLADEYDLVYHTRFYIKEI
jgi:hypothetical protein